MSTPMLSRLGPAAGIVFPIALFVMVGDGSQFTAWRAVGATWALILAFPFLVSLFTRLRTAESDAGWLSVTALVCGVAGVLLKLASHAPLVSANRLELAHSTSLYKSLDGMGGALTLLSLYPLAVCCAATAAVVLGTGALPRWIGALAGITAIALAVNACFVFADFVPGFLLFLLWTVCASAALLRQTWSRTRVGASTT